MSRRRTYEAGYSSEPCRSEKPSRLLSFLRKFRKPRDASYPSSPRLFLRNQRWESVESVLSSTTTTSFAFVPICMRRKQQEQQREYEQEHQLQVDNTVFLRRKYNLHGSDTIYASNRQRAYRHSCLGNENGAGDVVAAEPVRRSFSFSGRKCHKPGKRRAPQPPPVGNLVDSRKKRRAPPPPDTVCNDSLKLEKGLLKSNKDTVERKLVVCEAAVPLSPRPWYKRNANGKRNTDKVNKKERVESPEGFFRRQRFSMSKIDDKRRSQISMLANISELDRQAKEIVRKERKKEKDAADAAYFAPCSEMSEISATSSSKIDEKTYKVRTEEKAAKCEEKVNVRSEGKSAMVQNEGKSAIIQNEGKSAMVQNEGKSATVQSEGKSAVVQNEGKSTMVQSEGNLAKIQIGEKAATEDKSELLQTVERKEGSGGGGGGKPFTNWTCPQCTLENPSWKFICAACCKWRPYSVSTSNLTKLEFTKASPESAKGSPNMAESSSSVVITVGTSAAAKIENDVKMKAKMAKVDDEIRKARLAFFERHLKIEQNPDGKEREAATTSCSGSGTKKAHIRGSDADIDVLSRKVLQLKSLSDSGTNKDNKQITTLAINRLLKKLQTSIGSGQHHEAANLARELARLKIDCEVIHQKPHSDELTLNMYVEDKICQKGPIPVVINSRMTLTDLKDKIAKDFEIPRNVQKWILGKELAVEDGQTLYELGIRSSGSPIFLYLISPIVVSENSTRKFEKVVNDKKKDRCLEICSESSEGIIKRDEFLAGCFEHLKLPPESVEDGWKCEKCTLLNATNNAICEVCGSEKVGYKGEKDASTAESKLANYRKLIDMDKMDLVSNTAAFDCPVCLDECEASEGAVLRDCLHTFCKGCLSSTVEHSADAEVKCPYRDENYACDSVLSDREIKALVSPEIYERHLSRSITEAENKIENAFHCKTGDCKGWCIFEDNVNEFTCPICEKKNCLTCQAIHSGMNCKQYQEMMELDSDTNADAKRTKQMLGEMVEKGEAMICPTCRIILMKKWGCDWLKCSMCKTEICWVTRGPRWGPKGKGDTSGGCKCGVFGVKCHPKCNYCH